MRLFAKFKTFFFFWTKYRNVCVFSYSPILSLNPISQTLPDVHWKIVIIQIIHLLQESHLQLLNLLPLAHSAHLNENCSVLFSAKIHVYGINDLSIQIKSRNYLLCSPVGVIQHVHVEIWLSFSEDFKFRKSFRLALRKLPMFARFKSDVLPLFGCSFINNDANKHVKTWWIYHSDILQYRYGTVFGNVVSSGGLRCCWRRYC